MLSRTQNIPFFQNGVALPELTQRLARLAVVGINGLFSLSTTGTNIYDKSYF
jgi:dihydrodipicolinate synthase/N-acetylneuraminate lyase